MAAINFPKVIGIDLKIIHWDIYVPTHTQTVNMTIRFLFELISINILMLK